MWDGQTEKVCYQFVCLVPHGTVKVSRPSEVEQGKRKLTVGHNINIDPSVLHMRKGENAVTLASFSEPTPVTQTRYYADSMPTKDPA